MTTTNEIIDSLAELGIKLESHKLNDIIFEIEGYGIDIHKISGLPNKYYIGSRKFELSELKVTQTNLHPPRDPINFCVKPPKDVKYKFKGTLAFYLKKL